MSKKPRVGTVVTVCVAIGLWSGGAAVAQTPSAPGDEGAGSTSEKKIGEVPRLVKFAGALVDMQGQPQGGAQRVTFSVYAEQEGGTPLWSETQTVSVDRQGRYEVLLGQATEGGLSVDLFASGEAQWLGMQIEGQAEQGARVMLISVPYALKADDAATLGGRPIGDFVLAEQLKTPEGREALGLGGTGNGAFEAVTLTATGDPGPGLISLATSGPPLAVNSTEAVANLNADLLDGLNSTALQLLVTGTCAAGSAVRTINPDGTVVCEPSGALTLPFGASVTSDSPAFSITNTTTGSGVGVLGRTSATALGAAAVRGEVTAASGQTIGVEGLNLRSPLGTGVVGRGQATGGYFESTSPTGLGVLGISRGTGVLGRTSATAFGAAAVRGEVTATSGQTIGVEGLNLLNPLGTGVVGRGLGTGGYFESTSPTGLGVLGTSRGTGVLGRTEATASGAAAIRGEVISTSGETIGVEGVNVLNPQGTGVVGRGSTTGGFFAATTGSGVVAFSTATAPNAAAIRGEIISAAGQTIGVEGVSIFSSQGTGVVGRGWTTGGFFAATLGHGVLAHSAATALNAAAIRGEIRSVAGQTIGVEGVNVLSPDGTGVVGRGAATGGYFQNTGPGGSAIVADGSVRVNGNTTTRVLEITGGSDLSERFEVTATLTPGNTTLEHQIEPGMIVSIDPARAGKLIVSYKAYDRRAAGVISGAGGVKPGMLMSQSGTVADGDRPVALSGRVYAWADASQGPIEPGDLLTTSETPGHAMKVRDHKKAQGAIIGKALTGLREGKGLVLILVTLQ